MLRSPAEVENKGETNATAPYVVTDGRCRRDHHGTTGTRIGRPDEVGTETFTLTSDLDAAGVPVTASGLINDTGQDIAVSDVQDTFDFGDHGRITVFHSPLRTNQHLNQKKCSFRVTEQGTYVFGNGTGEWTNYAGSGKYTVNVEAVDGCVDTPVGTVTITATGPITVVPSGVGGATGAAYLVTSTRYAPVEVVHRHPPTSGAASPFLAPATVDRGRLLCDRRAVGAKRQAEHGAHAGQRANSRPAATCSHDAGLRPGDVLRRARLVARDCQDAGPLGHLGPGAQSGRSISSRPQS